MARPRLGHETVLAIQQSLNLAMDGTGFRPVGRPICLIDGGGARVVRGRMFQRCIFLVPELHFRHLNVWFRFRIQAAQVPLVNPPPDEGGGFWIVLVIGRLR